MIGHGSLYCTITIGAAGRRTIFQIIVASNLTTLHSFQDRDGFLRLTLGPDGNLYGALARRRQ